MIHFSFCRSHAFEPIFPRSCRFLFARRGQRVSEKLFHEYRSLLPEKRGKLRQPCVDKTRKYLVLVEIVRTFARADGPLKRKILAAWRAKAEHRRACASRFSPNLCLEAWLRIRDHLDDSRGVNTRAVSAVVVPKKEQTEWLHDTSHRITTSDEPLMVHPATRYSPASGFSIRLAEQTGNLIVHATPGIRSCARYAILVNTEPAAIDQVR